MTGPTVLVRTVCGLWVVEEDSDPRNHPNFTWHTEVIDGPGREEDDVARQFVRLELLASIGKDRYGGYVAPVDVWLGPMHEGHVDRLQYFLNPGADSLSLADPEVPGRLIERDSQHGPEDLEQYTVCGILEETGKFVCWQTVAYSPLVAYYQVWRTMQEKTGEHMLLCAIHSGNVAAID